MVRLATACGAAVVVVVVVNVIVVFLAPIAAIAGSIRRDKSSSLSVGPDKAKFAKGQIEGIQPAGFRGRHVDVALKQIVGQARGDL